jgi:hypothetical protein
LDDLAVINCYWKGILRAIIWFEDAINLPKSQFGKSSVIELYFHKDKINDVINALNGEKPEIDFMEGDGSVNISSKYSRPW